MKRLLVLLGAVALVLTMALPALAITRGGERDGNDHPYVGLMVSFSYNDQNILEAQGRCSGSLISPTVYVTAGHCTEGADKVMLWFDEDVQTDQGSNGYPDFSNIPDDFYFDAWGADGITVTGDAFDHPLYLPQAFFLYDLGVVVLDEPVEVERYAKLPEVGQVDDLDKGRKRANVVAVGYGLQDARQNNTVADKIRHQAELFVVNTEGVAGLGNLKLPSNLPPTNSMIVSGDAKHGGTCFGDSGGPALIGDTIVAVNSFGLNANCAGIGGMFRIDRDVEIGWISSFLED